MDLYIGQKACVIPNFNVYQREISLKEIDDCIVVVGNIYQIGLVALIGSTQIDNSSTILTGGPGKYLLKIGEVVYYVQYDPPDSAKYENNLFLAEQIFPTTKTANDFLISKIQSLSKKIIDNLKPKEPHGN